jgi:hypothetical protein
MGAGLGADRQTHAEIALMSLMSITFLLIHARTTYMQTSRLCQNRGKTICGLLSSTRARITARRHKRASPLFLSTTSTDSAP